MSSTSLSYEEMLRAENLQRLEGFIWFCGIIGGIVIVHNILCSLFNNPKKQLTIPEKEIAPLIKQVGIPLIPLIASLGDIRNLVIGLAIYALSLSALAKSDWRLWLILAFALSPLLVLLNNPNDPPMVSLYQTLAFFSALYGTLFSIKLHFGEHYFQVIEDIQDSTLASST